MEGRSGREEEIYIYMIKLASLEYRRLGVLVCLLPKSATFADNLSNERVRERSGEVEDGRVGEAYWRPVRRDGEL